MSEIHLTQFLKQYGLHELAGNGADAVPGGLLEKRFLRRGVEKSGHLSEFFTSMPKWFWETEVEPANLVRGAVSRTLDLSDDRTPDALETTVRRLLPNERRAQANVTRIVGRGFRVGPGRANKFSLLGLLDNLRLTQPDRWKRIEEKWVVLEVYYASEVDLRFSMDLRESLDLEVEPTEAAGVSLPRLERISSRRAALRNVELPIAFGGFRI